MGLFFYQSHMISHATAGSPKQWPSHWKPNSVRGDTVHPDYWYYILLKDVISWLFYIHRKAKYQAWCPSLLVSVQQECKERVLHRTQGKWQTLYDRLCKQIEMDRRGSLHFSKHSDWTTLATLWAWPHTVSQTGRHIWTLHYGNLRTTTWDETKVILKG